MQPARVHVIALGQCCTVEWIEKGAYTEGAWREGKEFGERRREIGAQPAVS
jgi:hypothetical protein